MVQQEEKPMEKRVSSKGEQIEPEQKQESSPTKPASEEKVVASLMLGPKLSVEHSIEEKAPTLSLKAQPS